MATEGVLAVRNQFLFTHIHKTVNRKIAAIVFQFRQLYVMHRDLTFEFGQRKDRYKSEQTYKWRLANQTNGLKIVEQ